MRAQRAERAEPSFFLGLSERRQCDGLTGYLLERRERSGRDVFTLGGSHSTVAEDLGTVREALGRNLRGLRDRGLITIDANGGITVLDEADLRAEADG
jgi:CRP-like cAMP-binding protein